MLLDIGLPGVSGLDVLSDLVEQEPDLPVVVLTAHDDDNVRRRCAEAGAAFVTKPLILAELRDVVSERLAGR